ncbi:MULTISPECIES: carbohydrate ABC transporter permease [Shouchella]|uniref:ABC transporter permease protein yesP n=3 Tax=Bacillaceae TaxID=186817 RepID=A0A060M6J2_9BACI|nr:MULTISPECIES: sugar ABC transporter permease [Bacillaceae]AIC96178.1 ABC transporter permease protein yesP [Shouchella lehensis G1]
MARVSMTVRPTSSTKKKKWTNDTWWALLFIGPTVLGLMTFYIGPAMASFALSFTHWDGLTAPSFAGMDNLIALFTSPIFLRSLLNTLVFMLVAVPASIAIATLIAVLLNQRIKGMIVYRALYFLPVVTMPIAVGMVWKWLYNTEYGLFNYFLGAVGLPQPEWLFNPSIALLSVIAVYVWMTIGNNVILILAGLQNVDTGYYEAAEIDGASKMRQFFSITLPLITPTLFFVMVTGMISSLQVFDLLFVMIGDTTALVGPLRTIVYGVYESGFMFSQMGYASAQAFVLFLLILGITILQFAGQKKWVHYDS